MGISDFKIIFCPSAMGQFSLIPNGKPIIVSQTAHTSSPCLEIFSKIPAIATWWHSPAFATTVSLYNCKIMSECGSQSID